jgi:prepilin-type processing-associated H-X9-DG protein
MVFAANTTPASPTFNTSPNNTAPYIYQAFNGANRFPDSMPDGTSKTIMFTEKFASCSTTAGGVTYQGGNFWAYPPSFPVPNATTSTIYNYGGVVGYWPTQSTSYNYFAPFYPALYQAQPQDVSCDPFNAQGPHPGGIINVGMGDGSVHSVSLVSDVTATYLTNGTAGIPQSRTWKSALTPKKQFLTVGNYAACTWCPASDPDVLGNDWPE